MVRAVKLSKLVGQQVLHPYNSLATIDATRGTYITTFCCPRNFVNISLATGEVTGSIPGGQSSQQSRWVWLFESSLPLNAFLADDASDQLTGVWNSILSDNVTFVQLWYGILPNNETSTD